MGEQVRGRLIIIGGAEDKKGDCIILRKFVELAGGRESRLTVLTTASSDPLAGEQYRRIFLEMGAEEVRVLAIQHRKEANEGQFHSVFQEVSGIFFTGGDQLRITGILGGSNLGRALIDSYHRGAVVAGTSAGASVMSETMLVGGSNDATPKKEAIRMAPGLGLLRDVLVDQHFAQRGRIGRLLAVVAHNPYILGVGIDEDTAIIVSPSDKFTVAGSGTVTVIDGRGVTYSNISDSSPAHPLTLTDVRLHILSPGFGYNLRERLVMMNKEDPSFNED